MVDLVPAEDIERIVGVQRHPTEHWANAVSADQVVYILHSRSCLAMHPDLRDCPWSLAMDAGIDLDEWTEDVPLLVNVRAGRLLPSHSQVGPVDPPRPPHHRPFA